MPSYRNVILGGGVAAGYAAQTYVERGREPGSLCIVTAEERVPYDRPPLSKDVLAGGMDPEEAVIEEIGFYVEHDVEVVTGSRVTSIDVDGRTLETADGEAIGWGNLLVATGSQVRRLDVPGEDRGNVFYLRTAGDAERILGAAEDAATAVVVGGSFIGTEVAASLTDFGLDVTQVYREDRLLKDRPLTAEMSAFYERVFREEGVDLRPGETVARFEGRARVSKVVLESGAEIEADLVVVGIGVVPDVEIFERTAIEIDDGIVVDDRLRTAIDGIRAAGDVARWPDAIFGRRRRVEHWDCARAQGEYWARAMTGEDEAFDYLVYFFSDAFDLSWEYWGDIEGAERVVYRGTLDDGSFSAWWLAEDRVLAAFVLDRPDEERDAAQRLIRSGRSVDADRLADEEAPLPE
ncbi:MAG: FAD-dependent oxidoreductase [Gemmatimonadetes bacterium]|nr:FAD-dependent oxidoreductase [Gemmatimonadota bacterium]